jgi:murein DD-endopeptidase MepM/ murein hydrolase activator NlpD
MPCSHEGGSEWVHPYIFKLNNGSESMVFLQDVCHPDKGQKTICYKPGAGAAYLLQGCFGSLWWEYNNMLGAPTSDEIRDKTMFPANWGIDDFDVMQTFEYGSMFWDCETGLVRMFNDYGRCELNREGTVIAFCEPDETCTSQISVRQIMAQAAPLSDGELPTCEDLSEETKKTSLSSTSDGFVFPVLAASQTDPTKNTIDPLTQGWTGHGVGWTEDDLIGHLGQDYYLSTGCSGTEGHPVFAVSNGTVVQVINNPDTQKGWNDEDGHSWGRVIVIKHTLAAGFKTDDSTRLGDSLVQANPKIVYSLYGHLMKDSVQVKPGDVVAKGQKIAKIGLGGTDVSWSCSHLHFELKDSTGYSSKEFAPKNNIQALCCKGQETLGIGFGYSGKDGSAPNRYIPSAFILKNKVLDKSLVKADGATDIFWLQNGQLYYVTSTEIINLMDGVQAWGLGNVTAMESLASYTLSSKKFIKTDGQSTGLLMKLTGTPHIYIVDGDKKTRIVSPEDFNQNGYDWADIIEVSQAVFDMFTSIGDSFNIEAGEGAASENIRQVFEDAYAGAAAVLGIATDIVKPVSSLLTDVSGFYQTFINGSIQYMSNGLHAGQAYIISNDVYSKWGKLGFAGNALGLPAGNKGVISSSFGTWGTSQLFEGGTIQLNGSTPFAVYGDVFLKWKQLGQEKGPLGFPTGDMVTDAISGFGTQGQYQRFQGGSIQVVGSHTHAVYDDIYDEWGKNGYAGQSVYEPGDALENGPVTWAGFPESDRYSCSEGECQDFEGGYIWTDGASAQFISTTHPEDLLATVHANGSVNLSWNNRIEAKGIYVYRAASPAERIASLGPGITQYLDNNAEQGIPYHYFVSAYNTTAESPYSSELSTGPAKVTGYVTDQRNGDPVPDAVISVNGVETLSAADGFYTLGIEAGQYTVTCSRYGYQTLAIVDFTLEPGQIVEKNFELSVSLYGRVVDRLTGDAIPNVHITTDDNQAFQNNILGDYTLGSLVPGTYDITFSHQDYPSLTIEGVEVKAGESFKMDVELSSPLSGTVTDLSSGKIISSVIVSTNIGQTIQSDSHGHYSFNSLNPGVYDISFAKTGYQTITISTVIIRPGESLPMDVQMTTPGLLNILSNDLPPAQTSVAYHDRVSISGGSYPYTYTIASGSLPLGTVLDPDTGNISGTPTQAGSYAFCIRVTDLLNAFAQRCFTIETTIPLSIETDDLLDGGTEDEYYQCSIAATGGTKPYQFFVSGDLPLDMYWNSSGNIWNKLTDTIDFNSGQLNFHWNTSASYIRDDQLYLSGSSSTSSAQIELECINGTITFDYETYFGCGYGFCGSLKFYIDGVLKKSWTRNADGRVTIPVTSGRHVFKWISTNSSPINRPWQNSKIDNITFPIEVEGNHYFTVQVQDLSGRVAEKQFYLNVNAALKIINQKLNNGIAGQVFNQAMASSGGLGSHTWGVYSGTLPKGLDLDSASGVLSGTPLEPFYGIVVFFVSDEEGRVTYKDLTIQVCDPLEILADSLPTALMGSQYSEAVRIKGGIGPYTFSYEGKLPDGLFLDNDTGIISGIATAEEQVNVSISVTDSTYPYNQSASQMLSITTSGNLTIITSAVLPKTQKGLEITPIILQAGGGSTPYAWSVAGGHMPDGISLNPETGVLSEIPLSETSNDKGDFLFIIQAMDAGNDTCQKEFFWKILDDLSIVTDDIPDGAIHKSFNFAINANGGQLPYYFRIKSGTLPSGLFLDNKKGSIYGTPTSRQKYAFTIEVSDGGSPAQIAEKAYQIEISDELFISTKALPNSRLDKAYTATITASLGEPPFQWRLESGALPEGLTLTSSPTVATLEGTPNTAGTYVFTIEVSDTLQNTVTREFTMEIYTDVIIDTTELERANPGLAYSGSIEVHGGMPPYELKIIQGSLPVGLRLNPTTGVISGAPDPVSGSSATFIVHVTDSGDPSGFTEKEFALWVVDPLEIITDTMTQGLQKTPFAAGFEGQGGIEPYTWSIAQGSLPKGMTLNPDTGALSGTPIECGLFNFTLHMEDSAKVPYSITKAFQWEVICCNDYEITGNINGMEGVTITLGGDASAVTTTDAQGNFRFEHLAIGNYTITTSLIGYKFEPSAINITDLKIDLSGLDFIAHVNYPPDEAAKPVPANTAVNIALNADLSWSGNDPDTGDTLTYDIYFGNSFNPASVATDKATTAFDPGLLLPNTTYYWRIVTKDNYGMVNQGPVWQFKTLISSQVQFKAEAFSVMEDEGTAPITLTRTGECEGEAFVTLSTQDGSAKSGLDYTFVTEAVIFAHGETGKSINIPIMNDGRLEGDETVHLSLSDPKGNAFLGEHVNIILTIQDDSRDVLAGDVDGSGAVDLHDLLMTLQVISNEISPSDLYKEADINGDGKIGIQEAIYMLQKIAD